MTYFGDIRLFYDPKSYPLLKGESRVCIFDALHGGGVGLPASDYIKMGCKFSSSFHLHLRTHPLVVLS